MAFDWQSELEFLGNSDGAVPQDSINRFANSELPNDFFLRQFTHVGEEPFADKKYWEYFALILISRGMEKTADVRDKMLIWLQDINWPGSGLIWNYVLGNFAEFKPAIKQCIITAIETDDEVWLYALLALSLKGKGTPESEISQKLQVIDVLYK